MTAYPRAHDPHAGPRWPRAHAASPPPPPPTHATGDGHETMCNELAFARQRPGSREMVVTFPESHVAPDGHGAHVAAAASTS
jgi:hypothetical protein